MTQHFNQQMFAYAKQFTDHALKAQAVMLKSLEQTAELQLGAWERQSRSTAEFLVAATELRDAEGMRGLWDKGVALGRVQAEQAAALTQGLVAVGRQTAESLGALVPMQPAANEAVAGAGRKAAGQ